VIPQGTQTPPASQLSCLDIFHSEHWKENEFSVVCVPQKRQKLGQILQTKFGFTLMVNSFLTSSMSPGCCEITS
jgi:hypothetical protein